jgi:GNAT superfamily N-acetyltransferase
MNILEYDEVDPLDVLHLNLMALDFPLTPELATHIRRVDPRPFPCFALYAVRGNDVLGQVGVFRLPMVSTAGREDVGGVWAVLTHPEHAGRRIASCLLQEAHARMRAAGLRFSTLATDRFRGAYRLYEDLGYTDMQVGGTAFARWDTAHQPTRLSAERSEEIPHEVVEAIFGALGQNRLGFAWRHTPFAPLRDKVGSHEIWVLRQHWVPVGYALAHLQGALVRVSNLLLADGISVSEAVAAVITRLKADYVTVTVTRPGDAGDLRRAGYRLALPDWSAFMVKPLVPDVSAEDARRIYGIGTDRFLISWLDTT